ncbi:MULTISPECIES: phage head closure protein [Clostridium]|jgi:SPP1 family predicted phage head-tail adaptor|uniref:phage head closure protein n=1 Tax=Clostridium TaxID=1485 RepID=UPI00040FFAEF|nr:MULTISPECIES: phage head closure protein [Clostridium]DAL12885.1 MAG TPA_asm: Putative head tail adaptor [Caudoviricetes sp.]AOY53866.1 hypothetical protein FORC25_1451 [Clostridium perfringens]EGT4144228.1 head-tail adaptor protein [Clostridium perfringens]EHK2400145.1 phage head closure protein [Clostridium perfringens]EHK2406186.1 phage head closure protein [Clostridium perfringens]
MNCRSYKHKIIIKRAIGVKKNDDGLPIPDYKEILTCRARISNTSGKEINFADGEGSVITTRFYIRYIRDLNLTNKDILIYNGKEFNIVYCSNIKEENKEYEIVGEYNG